MSLTKEFSEIQYCKLPAFSKFKIICISKNEGETRVLFFRGWQEFFLAPKIELSISAGKEKVLKNGLFCFSELNSYTSSFAKINGIVNDKKTNKTKGFV